ncbi:MAG: hypothetical protein IIC83_12525, partial [Chloroflexi bacterium]|nr:hypothetical protein [Chloroflexota bacterium]
MKFFWLGVVTFLSTAFVLAACGGGAPVAEKPESTPDSASTIVVADERPLSVIEPTPELKIGSAIGERAPDFEVTFLDGTSVSREELAAEGRPAFLYFMAT